MRNLFAALSMLTILPMGKFCPSEKELRGSLNFFPLVGLIVGLLSWGGGLLMVQYGGGLLMAAMGLTLLPEIWTKGFHLDGLADSADGMLSGRDRERKLEIMRDSHIGSMGVLAIVALLGFKFAAYGSMRLEIMAASCAVAALGGRCAVVWYIAFSRYARKEGLGRLWFGSKPWIGMALGVVLLSGAGFWFYGLAGLYLVPGVVLLAFLWSRMTAWVLGGATGDTIGCFEELAELAILFFAVSQ